MKTRVQALKVLVLFFCVMLCSEVSLFSQQISDVQATDLIRKNAGTIGLSRADLQNLRISYAYIDQASGATLVYVQQTFRGIDVFNSIQTFAFKNEKLVSVTGRRINKMDVIVNSSDGKPVVAAADAVRSAVAHLNLPAPPFLVSLKQLNPQQFEFGDLGISSVSVKSKLIWLPDEVTNTVALTWQVEIQPNNSPDYWLINVNALQGMVIDKINLNLSCNWNNPKQHGEIDPSYYQNDFCDDDPDGITAINSAKYRVVAFPAESPLHPGGTPSLRTNPWTLAGAGNNATTLTWNDDGTVTYDSTHGNNVLAQEDRNGNNGFGKGAVSTTAPPDLTFNFKPNFSKQPTTAVNLAFALTNLFYWNNIMHDISYQYGFDEVSGNFQKNNLGRGGAGNDFVFADAQDGSGSNNANFSTPADGSNPRMQMFLFDAVPMFTVNQPVSFAGFKSSAESAVSRNNKLAARGPINDTVVLYSDNAADTSHYACGAAFNAGALKGKIALIDRGNACNFTVKIKNAQNAGAVAVIVADNIPGEYPFVMGGTDNTISIPAVMVSFETGDTMKQILAAHTLLTVTMKTGVKLDGDVDNGVISHEYTHGISNRLTGGPLNVACLTNAEQMGEGWSDYMALMVTTNWSIASVTDGTKARPLGTYVLGQGNNGPGIRVHPYSTDMSINPWTYADLPSTGGEPHNVGEIWCTALWEMTWDIIQQAGINSNLYNANANGGNNIALKLMMQGLKLQPCSPGFIDGRNAILKADTILFGGQYSQAIWTAFAKRGMGVFASEGSSNNYKDGVADFTVPSFAPIVKENFNAVKQDGSALLQWQNFNQSNNSKFVIERSTDGSDFKAIGTVAGNSKANTSTIYNFTDHQPVNGNNHYRLRQTTATGTVVYSAVRTVNFNKVSVVPNPAIDNVSITVNGNNKPLKVYLVNSTGQQIRVYDMNSESIHAVLPHLAQGMYYLKITGEGIFETQKLVIQ